MKNLERFTDSELVAQFRNTCLAQYDTYLTEDIAKRNKLFDVLLLLARELKHRGIDKRRYLMRLFADTNAQVRLQAANFVYAAAPNEAKACLEAIAAAGLPDQSLSAGMTLHGLQEDPHCLDWI